MQFKQPLVYQQSALFNGPFGIDARLLQQIAAAPFEGLWTPVGTAKQASLEVNNTGTVSALALGLYGTNNPDLPQNTYTLTIGGSITTSDVLSAVFTNPNLPAGSKTVSYTTVGGDTLTTAAAALAALIQADPLLNPLGFTATSLVGVITIQFPSFAGQVITGDPQNPQFGNFTQITTSVTGSVTETMAVTVGTDGFELSALTAVGFSFSLPSVNYIKARLTTLTGGGTISAFYHGVA
jgi:hypothetical protein